MARHGLSPGLQDDRSGQYPGRRRWCARRRSAAPPACATSTPATCRAAPGPGRHALPAMRRSGDRASRISSVSQPPRGRRRVPRLRRRHSRRVAANRAGGHTRTPRPGAHPLRVSHGHIHISPYSGAWYPASAGELRALCWTNASPNRRAAPAPSFCRCPGIRGAARRAGILGHGGRRRLSRHRQQQPERIVLLAFPHRGGLGGVAVPRTGSISTPLGDVAIDRSLRSAFRRVAGIALCDHSFEIQLPFLQKHAPGARITPLYVGPHGAHPNARMRPACWLQPGIPAWSSWHRPTSRTTAAASVSCPSPTTPRWRIACATLDFECIEAAGEPRRRAFSRERWQRNRATVCGAEPIALLLDVLRRLPGGGSYQTVARLPDLRRDDGRFRHSVSYAALGYYDGRSFALDAADSAVLLEQRGPDAAAPAANRRREPVPRRGGSPALEVAPRPFREPASATANCWAASATWPAKASLARGRRGVDAIVGDGRPALPSRGRGARPHRYRNLGAHSLAENRQRIGIPRGRSRRRT